MVACGGSPVQSVAPTAETIAFLRLDPAALRGCVDVESVVVDGVAGLITGSENAAMASAARTGLQRCGETGAAAPFAAPVPVWKHEPGRVNTGPSSYLSSPAVSATQYSGDPWT